ncbi:UPF0481 protein At3g47200-like [Telopea speciosissima]|uniref:UPF0481 protein At3g47200-like n=1 Tax=Telopea speciosissima TaxID=54955 RepID=UPI001CC661EB|nr:UPF0481 protein At3g47200-like [Telopea speciosissima]
MAHVTDTEREHYNCEDLDLITSARDAISVMVESIQKDLKEVPSLSFNCSIYRVPKLLRKIKPEAYTPHMVSIGPYHRYKKHLQPMEAHKLRYLNDHLSRESSSPSTLANYVKAMTELEDRTRQCYSEMIQLKSDDEFVKMMLIDGCFILELILRTKLDKSRHRGNDLILNATWLLHVIKRDLILLENQLPFFVLECLYNLFTKNSSDSNKLCPVLTFSDHAHHFFGDFVPTQPQSINHESLQCRPRFFDVAKKNVSDFFCVTRKKDQVKLRHFSVIVTNQEFAPHPLGEEKLEATPAPHPLGKKKLEATPPPKDKGIAVEPNHLLDFVRELLLRTSSMTAPTQGSYGKFAFTRSATELNEANVKFKKVPTTCLMDITFRNGVLKIPTMKIEDRTEFLLRNLIAFEQSHDEYPNDITAYAAFIDCLIDSPKDVELLQEKGIIDNFLGHPEEVASLFNGLLKEVIITDDNFYFSGVCRELEKHYKLPWHKWKASLMLNYFNTPWTFISFLAALFLLILTVVQTICSILQVK